MIDTSLPPPILPIHIEETIRSIAKLQADLGVTTIYVTHDQIEAMTMGDRVAVMRRGRIVELAPAPQIFAAPQHPYTRILLSAVPSPDPDVPMNFQVAEELARLDAAAVES